MAPAQDVTLAALGDSLVQGYGLPPEQGFVPTLESWLAANGHGAVEIVNAGVSGDTTRGGLSRVDWTLTPEIDGVIVVLGGNDLLRGLDPAQSRENLDGILAAIRERGLPVLLSGMQAPGNYGPDYKQAFDSMYAELAEKHGAILHPFFLRALNPEDPGNLSAASPLVQPDGIHPNAEGVERIVADIGPFVVELAQAAAE